MMEALSTIMPRQMDEYLERLCKKIGATRPPVHIKITPTAGAAPLECFGNINSYIEQKGGSIQYGWLLWEWPNVLVEAEFHAVWVSPSGEIRDITPRLDGDTDVLFLPDDRRTYEGKYVDNIRLAVREDKLIHDFIFLAEKRFAAKSSGDWEYAYRLEEYSIVAKEMLEKGLRASAQCLCGSGAIYRRCHGRLPI